MNHLKTLIFVPTYNERENVEQLCADIRGLRLDTDIMFLDDNSPDGTGDILDELTEKHPAVKVVHRPGKLGIGSAHMDGIAWAYDNGYELLITMDSDYSHKPGYLPDFIAASRDCDVVIGTRFMAAESLRDWSPGRKLLTSLGHLLTRTLLRIRYDATGAFRAYRLDVIPPQAFGLVRSNGYSFFFESLFILQANGFTITEIPIELPPRTYGHSKMRLRDALHSLSTLLRVFFESLFRPSNRRLPDSKPPRDQDRGAKDIEAWDKYWKRPTTPATRTYQKIAQVYRKSFIRRNLNRIVGEQFRPASRVLHAGCGTGEVDTGIPGGLHVIALDISIPALRTYGQIHRNSSSLVRGSVFRIPLRNGSMDGIYHLGLMEHFTEQEIHLILTEFNRVLRRDGKMIVFWPPRFGLSVYALKGAHFVLNRILRRDVKLHPDEITLLRSKEHAVSMFEKARFAVDQYYFGPRDLFSQSMIVVSKTAGAVRDETG